MVCALQLLVWIETRWWAGTVLCSASWGAKHMVNGWEKQLLEPGLCWLLHITDCYTVSLHCQPKCLIPTAGGRWAPTHKKDFELCAGSGCRSDIIGKLKMSGVGGGKKGDFVVETIFSFLFFSFFLNEPSLHATKLLFFWGPFCMSISLSLSLSHTHKSSGKNLTSVPVPPLSPGHPLPGLCKPHIWSFCLGRFGPQQARVI